MAAAAASIRKLAVIGVDGGDEANERAAESFEFLSSQRRPVIRPMYARLTLSGCPADAAEEGTGRLPPIRHPPLDHPILHLSPAKRKYL
jgi:hypothetical protein